MLVLVSYDVSTEDSQGSKRLRHVAKICEDYGQRVQHSLFECLVDPGLWLKMKKKLESTIDSEKDSLRYYYLGSNWNRKIEHVGAKPSYDPEGSLIV